jgi:hypothetical protein
MCDENDTIGGLPAFVQGVPSDLRPAVFLR